MSRYGVVFSAEMGYDVDTLMERSKQVLRRKTNDTQQFQG